MSHSHHSAAHTGILGLLATVIWQVLPSRSS
ncbi:hypothetical protein YWIDRAFT_00320 [Streptomyces sp. SceaMP-e96]|nr:hypothetical protein YWIDRAFT_00320 [Streptomyces sp. SceaMP-e96]